MTFERFTVVKVPFPFTNKSAKKRRPALVLSDWAAFNAPAGHSVLAMITSALHTPWPLDYVLQDLGAAGLRKPSMVRFKLFTLDQSLILGVLGTLSPQDAAGVEARLKSLLRLD